MMEVVGAFADTLPLGLALESDEPLIALGQRIGNDSGSGFT